MLILLHCCSPCWADMALLYLPGEIIQNSHFAGQKQAASNVDLKLESFLSVEYIQTAELGCTALQHERLTQRPKHRHLAPFETPQGIRDIFRESAKKIWQQTSRKPISIWHGKLEARRETPRHLKWHWMPKLSQLNWDPSTQIQKLYPFIYFKCSYNIYGVTFSSSTPQPRGYQPTAPAFTNTFLAPSNRNPGDWTTVTTNTPTIETQLSILSWVLHHVLLKRVDLSSAFCRSPLEQAPWATSTPSSPYCGYLRPVIFSLIPFRSKNHGNL